MRPPASHTDAAQTVDSRAEMVSLLPQAAAPVLAGPDLDVRDVPPAERHLRIFDTYHALLPGTGFVLVNDHDPKPLRYQFEAQHSGEHTWDYVEAGPRLWRVRIGRPAASGAQRSHVNQSEWHVAKPRVCGVAMRETMAEGIEPKSDMPAQAAVAGLTRGPRGGAAWIARRHS